MTHTPTERSNSWEATEYDDAHSYLFEYGADVVSLLDPRADERILDLGCGTGHLTADIAKRGTDVVGVEDSFRDEQFEDGSWIADYRRLRFVAVRTGD